MRTTERPLLRYRVTKPSRAAAIGPASNRELHDGPTPTIILREERTFVEVVNGTIGLPAKSAMTMMFGRIDIIIANREGIKALVVFFTIIALIIAA
jgi:hypothetical protein